MYFGLNTNNERICIYNANKQEEYFCPICHGKLRIRAGKINAMHFSHINLQECDDFTTDMSEWHRQWQEQFPTKNREYVIEFNGEKHRADVLACGYVIEFQHSPISSEEFNRRNNFYISAGYKVIWIFDFIAEFEERQMDCYDEWCNKYDNGGKWKWKNPKRFMQNFLPQRDKNIIVFFQTTDSDFKDENGIGYIEKITWAIDENGLSNFHRFYTSYYPSDKTELIEFIKQKKL